MKHIALITPAISSLNLGDQILFRHISAIVNGMFPEAFLINIPAYNKFDERSKFILDKCDLAFFCGTGPLSDSLGEHWAFGLEDYQNKVVLLGCGWNNYEEDSKMDNRTENLLKSALSDEFSHSVRDWYTQEKMEQLPQFETIDTACPSMWGIDNDNISDRKSKKVLFTLNSVRGNYVKDRQMCQILSNNYEDVFFLAQSPFDSDYAKSMGIDYKQINSTVENLDALISQMDFDYVGHRLHGGIHCLNGGKRSLIIGIDNRAITISETTGLPIFEYDEIENIEHWINNPEASNIILPEESINEWAGQF